MPKVIRGSKEAKKFVNVTRGGDIRKIKCTCGNYAVAAPDGKGGIMQKCICGKMFKSTSLD
jgi:hypothetical protein